MSFGALSAQAKQALGAAANEVGTSTTTGDGGMTDEERQASKTLVYQCLPSRYGFNPAHLRQPTPSRSSSARAPSPAAAACSSARRSARASHRCAPSPRASTSAPRAATLTGQDPTTCRSRSRSCARRPSWEKPVYVKVGATRVSHDVKLAVAAGADVVVVDGMQGGTGATQDTFIEHAGIPTLAAVRQASDALRELGVEREVQLIVSGGIRTGADVAKALALGADAVSIGIGALLALGCNRPTYRENSLEIDATPDYAALGTRPGECSACHTGRCPVGITTQDDLLSKRLDPDLAARRVANYLRALDHGGHDAGPRLRQVRRAQPGAGGPRRADDRGRRHGQGAAGRAPTGSREPGREPRGPAAPAPAAAGPVLLVVAGGAVSQAAIARTAELAAGAPVTVVGDAN